MKFKIDESFLIDCFREIVETPSPVGYYVKLNPVLERYAAKFGKTVTYDNKSTAYITLEGEDNSKTVLVGAHADTLGLVKRIWRVLLRTHPKWQMFMCLTLTAAS